VLPYFLDHNAFVVEADLGAEGKEIVQDRAALDQDLLERLSVLVAASQVGHKMEHQLQVRAIVESFVVASVAYRNPLADEDHFEDRSNDEEDNQGILVAGLDSYDEVLDLLLVDHLVGQASCDGPGN
jgi:hypothetical protein